MSSLVRRTTTRDDGSLILSLLAVLVVAGLAVSLVAVVVVGQQNTRRDRSFNQAIHGADAGVQQAVLLLSDLDDPSLTTLDSSHPNASGTTTVGNTEYEWTATKIAPQSWRVVATGNENGRERTVEAIVERPARFFLAAFADIGFTMRGANVARSYNATSSGTGNGAVGSNGAITMNGNAFADIVMLLGGGATCNGAATGTCGSNAGSLVGFNDPFDIDAMAAEISQSITAVCGGTPTTNYLASRDGQLGPGEHCFNDVTFDVDSPLGGGVSADAPVRIYMVGTLRIGDQQRAHVNCTSACATNGNQAPTVLPEARRLIINSTGPSVQVKNQSSISAAVAAPNADCTGSPSSAQADIYGSFICDSVTNQGGWKFNFDDRLLTIGEGSYDIVEWAERVGP